MTRMKNGKRLVAFLTAICLITMGSAFFAFSASAANVVPSSEEYTLSFRGINDVFFGNARAIDAKAGTEVYITYTVDTVWDENDTVQHGIVATDQPELAYPYKEGGVVSYSMNAPLLKEGYTYFFKFTYTDEEFKYTAASSKGDESEYVVFANSTGDATDEYTHFGVWFGTGKVSVRLTHVRCYDQNGNDLGVYAPKHRDSLMDDAKLMNKDQEVDHKYNITIENGLNVAISNAKETGANTVYMEYTVKSCDAKIYQTGVLNHKNPKASYPHTQRGCLLMESFQKEPGHGYLLQEGASYIIKFQRKEQFFLTLVQKTYNGKSEFHEFTSSVGEYVYGNPYFGLWFGEGQGYTVNCELTDFKCYDENKNNLGVQTNDVNGPAKITHFGAMEDYSGCEAMYYCRDTKGVVALYRDQTAKVTRDDVTENITYKIKDNVLELIFDDQTETYEYFYQQFTDEDGNSYVRLGTYYVDFVTGTDKNIERLTVDAGSGYTIASPAALTKDGAEFQGWYLSDGAEYNFDSIVDSSITLYAKWSDEPNYMDVDITEKDTSVTAEHPGWFFPAVISAILVAAGIIAGIVVGKKGKKSNGSEEKETSK